MWAIIFSSDSLISALICAIISSFNFSIFESIVNNVDIFDIDYEHFFSKGQYAAVQCVHWNAQSPHEAEVTRERISPYLMYCSGTVKILNRLSFGSSAFFPHLTDIQTVSIN